MPPPGLLAAPRSGGTTSPSKSELIDRDTRETFVMGEAEDAIDSDPAPEVLR